MELRSRDGTTHFIRTIKRGREIIAHNTNFQGRPVIKFKTLKDVYENEGANGLWRLSSGLVYGHEQVKHEDTCFPHVDRTPWGIEPKSDDELSPVDHNLDSSLDDDTTLKQLKKRLFTKKRKDIPTQEERKAVLEESDLHEPLINLKPKHSKTSKSKRRRVNLSIVSSSAVDFAIKYDENSDSEVSQVICVKVEVPEEGLNPGETSTNVFQNMALCDYREKVICAQEYQNSRNDAPNIFYDYVEGAEPIYTIVPWDGPDKDCVSYPDSIIYSRIEQKVVSTEDTISDEGQALTYSFNVIRMNGLNCEGHSEGELLKAEEKQTKALAITDGVSQSSLENRTCDIADMIPTPKLCLPPENLFSTRKEQCLAVNSDEDFLDFPPPHIHTENEITDAKEYPSSPDKDCVSYPDSIIYSRIEQKVVSTEDTISDEGQPLTYSFNVIRMNGLKCEGHSEGELLKAEEKQTKALAITDGVTQSSLENQTCDNADMIPTPKLCLPPENLFSTRKEQCLRMNSDDLEHVEIQCEEFLDFPPPHIHTENEITDAKEYPSSPDKDCVSYPDSSIYSRIEQKVVSTEDTISDEGQALTYSFNVIRMNDLNCEGHSEGESLKAEEKQTKALAITDGVTRSFLENQTCDIADMIPTPKLCLPPENLFSIRKEQCLAMNSVDIWNDAGQKECKENPFGKQTTKKASSLRSEIQHDKATLNHIQPDKVRQRKIIIKPRQIIKKSQVPKRTHEEQCLQMNSADIWNDAGQNECKENPFGKQTTKKASSLRSEIQHDNANVNHIQPDKVRQRKIIIKPRQMIKKSQVPKRTHEVPRFSRGLPKISTECTSIQSCSERAVEFSKQQMHNMESLALKLMNELKSMKDIMEHKLLFEAYRHKSLKSDADKVKSALKSASKVEETSRKWLSIMSRDCNRFCKIMNMTPSTTAAPKDTTPSRERKKLVFADEAGGNLCHVKFF